MGNNSSRNPEDYDIVRNYRSQQWQLSSTNSTPQLWKNRKTHELAEIFRLYAIPTIQDMNRYEIRSTQQNFVKAFHIAFSTNQALCFNQQYVRVLIEYIPIKLQNVSGLELEEALTILLSTFKGFNALSNNFGLIEPHQQLIGFNHWGKTKVWLNKQHNNNFPSQIFITNHLEKSRVQASHVRKIFDLIQRKTHFGQLPFPLKQLFRVNNPDYEQGIYIVEQFAYQNHLSLQRFIRTDLYVRKSSISHSKVSNYNRQIKHLRGASNQKVNRPLNNIQGFQRPQLKRINSVDTLLTQRPMNNSQITVSFKIAYKQNINNLSLNKFGYNQARSSIPRVHFQRSNQSGLPFLNKTVISNNNPYIQIKKSLIKQPSQHVKSISILSHQTQSQNIQEKSNQQHVPKLEYPNLNIKQPEINQEYSQKNHQLQQVLQKQKSRQEFSCPKNQSNIDIIKNQQPFSQEVQTSHSRSIIDKVEIDMISQDLESANIKYISNTKKIDNQQRDEDIQVSGTFNYKVLYQRDNIEHIHQPLQQIREQEESKIKETQEHDNFQSHHQIQKQVNQLDQRQNIPINFESFAPFRHIQRHLVSFAPNNTSLPSEQSIPSEEKIQTSKSFQYLSNDRINQRTEDAQSIGYIHLNAHQPINAQIERMEVYQAIQYEDVRDMSRLLQGKKRLSIDLGHVQKTQKPFYTNVTPVQSKFDVVVRRDSTFSQQSQRRQRASAFAHLDTDEQIQNYVRSKYLGSDKDGFHQKVKLERVQSHYQKHYIKQPEVYEFSKKEQPKKEFQKEENRGYLRTKTPANNNKISNISQKPEQDLLDVNFLQRSLDKRYSGNKKSEIKKGQVQDQLNIAKLDEGLMKFSISKASATDKSSKQQKYDSSQPKGDYKNDYYKWQNSTGFEYQTKPKQNTQLDNKKKKKSVRIENIPTQQFVYQLSTSDSSWKKYSNKTTKSPNHQTYLPTYNARSNVYQEYETGKTSNQKASLDDRYNKYVRNTNKNDKLPKNASINPITSTKGDSQLMLSPIPEKRFEEDTRLSYDQLRSFLWG